MSLLGAAGHEVIAPDWIGHGSSSIPVSSQFGYTADAYVGALEAFVSELGIAQPFHLVVQVDGRLEMKNTYFSHSNCAVLLVSVSTVWDVSLHMAQGVCLGSNTKARAWMTSALPMLFILVHIWDLA